MTRRPKPIKEHKEVDEDLRELAEVLDEHRLDQDAAGWFVVPWHHGYNATSLAFACFKELQDGYQSKREEYITEFLRSCLVQVICIETDYERAAQLLERIDTDNVSPHLIAALRCLQVWIANSSGGGKAYNDILRRAFDKTEPSHLLEDVVLEWRCRDAIRTTSTMQHDSNDRARHAFTIAWKRGLFHAAYSIAPVAKEN